MKNDGLSELFEDVNVKPYHQPKHKKMLPNPNHEYGLYEDEMHILPYHEKEAIKHLYSLMHNKKLTPKQIGAGMISSIHNNKMLGGSFWSDLIGIISDVLPFVSSSTAWIPIIGPLISTGALALSALGKVGTEVYRQYDENDPGIPSIKDIAKSSLKRFKNIGSDVIEYFEDKDKPSTYLPARPDKNVYKPETERYRPVMPTKPIPPKPHDPSKPVGFIGRGLKGSRLMKEKMAYLRSLKGRGKETGRIKKAIQQVQDFDPRNITASDIAQGLTNTALALGNTALGAYLDYETDYKKKNKPSSASTQSQTNLQGQQNFEYPEYNPRPFEPRYLDEQKYPDEEKYPDNNEQFPYNVYSRQSLPSSPIQSKPASRRQSQSNRDIRYLNKEEADNLLNEWKNELKERKKSVVKPIYEEYKNEYDEDQPLTFEEDKPKKQKKITRGRKKGLVLEYPKEPIKKPRTPSPNDRFQIPDYKPYKSKNDEEYEYVVREYDRNKRPSPPPPSRELSSDRGGRKKKNVRFY